MDTAECCKVGDPDPAGYREYSFWVEIGGKKYLYQVRARSIDEAFAEVGRNVSHDFEQLREFGSTSAALLVVATLVGGVVLGAKAIKRVLGYLQDTLTPSAAPNPPATPKPTPTTPRPLNANEALIATDEHDAPRQASRPPVTFATADPYPWRPVTEFGASGWRAGPVGSNAWRVIVFTDGDADLIRREFVREPEVNPETNTTTDGVVVYRFPLTALDRVRVGGPGVVEVAISPTRPRGELGFLEVVAQSEEEALRFLIDYFDFIR